MFRVLSSQPLCTTQYTADMEFVIASNCHNCKVREESSIAPGNYLHLQLQQTDSVIMGYAIDLFPHEEDIHEEFVCSICQDVLKYAKMIQPCEHTFCGLCIEQWRADSNTCPNDRKQIDALKELPRPFAQVLGSLKVHCPHCHRVLSLSELEEHAERCDMNRSECIGGCGALLNPSERGGHDCVVFLLKARADDLRGQDMEIAKMKEELKVRAEEIRRNDDKSNFQLNVLVQEIKMKDIELGKLKKQVKFVEKLRRESVQLKNEIELVAKIKEFELGKRDHQLKVQEDEIKCKDTELKIAADELRSYSKEIEKQAVLLQIRDRQLREMKAQLEEQGEELRLARDEKKRDGERSEAVNADLKHVVEQTLAKEKQFKKQGDELQNVLAELASCHKELKAVQLRCRCSHERIVENHQESTVTLKLVPDSSRDKGVGLNSELLEPRPHPSISPPFALKPDTSAVCLKNMQDTPEFVGYVKGVIEDVFQRESCVFERENLEQMSREIRTALGRSRHLLVWRVTVVKCDAHDEELRGLLMSGNILLFCVSDEILVGVSYK